MEDQTQQFIKPSRGPLLKESYFLSHNLSGRFWIALVLVFGLVLATILVVLGQVKLDSNAVIAVYTSFSSGAIGLIGIYMGQNSKPNAQKESPAPAK